MEEPKRASRTGGSYSSLPAYQPLVVVLLAAAAGIISDRLCPLGFWAWWTLAGVAVLAWLVVRLEIWRCAFRSHIFQHSKDRREFLGGVLILLAVLALSGAWEHCRWYLLSADDLGRYARTRPQPVCIECWALQSPRRLPSLAPGPQSLAILAASTTPPNAEESYVLEVEPFRLRKGAKWVPVSGRAALRISGGRPNLEAGDRLRCFAQLVAPHGRENPGGLDHAARLRAAGIFCKLYADSPQCLTVLQPASRWNPRRILYRIRYYSSHLLRQHLTINAENEHVDELAQAILLGQRRQLDPQLAEDFLVTGTLHLLVVSGLHVGILAGAVYWLFRCLPCRQKWSLVGTSLVVLFYLTLVDVGPSVFRATIMILTVAAAAASGRRAFSFNSLAAAGLVILAWNPNDLFHIGTQFSFLSTAGLLWCISCRRRPAAKNSLERLIEANWPWPRRMGTKLMHMARELLVVSATLWLLTTPLVMARFHLCSPIGVVLNPFLWWPTACSLLGGFLLLVCGSFFAPVAELCGGFCRLNLLLLEKGVGFARSLPAGYFWLPGPSNWWLWGFYGGLGLLAAFPRLRPPLRWQVGLLAGWIAIGLLPSVFQPTTPDLQCTFLSMGHGTAVLVEMPSGKKFLYDAGRMGAPALGARSIAEALWSRGIVHLDAVFLSHADYDHYNALPELLERFSVGTIYTPPGMLQGDNPHLEQIRQALLWHDVACKELSAGQCLSDGEGCRLEVLHPPSQPISGGNNSNSLVLLVESLGRRVLLTGDIESRGTKRLLAGEPRDCDVLLAPHHGSKKSNSSHLAAWCRPQWVVISGDGRWEAAGLDGTFAVQGGQVLRTWQLGAIRIQVTPAGARAWDSAGNPIKRQVPLQTGPFIPGSTPKQSQ